MADFDPLSSALSSAFHAVVEPMAGQLADALDRVFRESLRRALIARLEVASPKAATTARAPRPRTRRAATPTAAAPTVEPAAPSSPDATPSASAPAPTPAPAPVERVVRAPIVIRLPPKRQRAERRSSEQIEILEQRILTTLGARPEQRLDTIADAVGARRGTLTWPISRLIAAKKVVAAGEPGASVYSLAPPPPPTVTRIIRRPAASAPKIAAPKISTGDPGQPADLRPQPT